MEAGRAGGPMNHLQGGKLTWSNIYPQLIPAAQGHWKAFENNNHWNLVERSACMWALLSGQNSSRIKLEIWERSRLSTEHYSTKCYLIWEFPRIHSGDPPRNGTKLFTGLLQPTFKEGTGSFVSGGPYLYLCFYHWLWNALLDCLQREAAFSFVFAFFLYLCQKMNLNLYFNMDLYLHFCLEPCIF